MAGMMRLAAPVGVLTGLMALTAVGCSGRPSTAPMEAAPVADPAPELRPGKEPLLEIPETGAVYSSQFLGLRLC